MTSAHTNSYIGSVLLDFPVKAEYLNDKNVENLNESICKLLELHFVKLSKVFCNEIYPGNSEFGRLTIFIGEKGVTTTIRTYPTRSHVTVTVEYDLKNFGDRAPITFDEIQAVELKLAKGFEGIKNTRAIPQVKRALDFDIYFTTSDDRILEYDIKEMLFDDRSEFQHVQIARSGNYGNVLILDGMVNLAESDLVYTESIMCRGKVDYTGKDILILGGGDGALLYELRQEKANSITMIDIDDMVMKACRVHLRKASDDTLDNYRHQNYEIVVGDCIPFMIKCQSEGKLFDFVFGDLTDIPVTPTRQGEIWDFLKKTLELSFSILKPTGHYFTHANGISATESLQKFESILMESLKFPITINKTTAFVPSFKEKWVFYQLQRKH